LWAAASSLTTAQADASELPITMMAGETAWLLGELRDDNAGRGWRIKADGANIKLTVLFNSRIVGRLWLKGSKARPQFTGGSQDTFYVPGPWFSDGAGKLAILLEALDGEEPPMLESLSFIPVSDPVAR
jgi:beta-galactosidase